MEKLFCKEGSFVDVTGPLDFMENLGKGLHKCQLSSFNTTLSKQLFEYKPTTV